MSQRDNILQELHELNSILADVNPQSLYRVSPGYFDELADDILSRVRALESSAPGEELANLSPLLSSLSKKMPHSVPKGYFDTLEKKLEQTISNDINQSAEEELETLSPLLSGLKKRPTYSMPEGYLENLKPAIVTELPSAKIVSLSSRKWFRYAAAAVMIGFVATISFILLNKKDIDPGNKSYAWVEKNMKKVSTNDIAEFVELANAENSDMVKADTKDDLNNLLKDVSDKEIQDFLNDTQLTETGTDDDLILN